MSNEFRKMKNHLISICYLLLYGAVTTSCASFYNIEADHVPKYHKPKVIVANYDVTGRFSINDNEHHEYGNFNWTKQDNKEELDLTTPIGQSVAEIKIESGSPTLITKDRTYTGDDIEDLLYQHLGIILPVQYLHYWVVGVPFPDSPVTKWLFDGFMQNGFRVEYLDWDDDNHPKIVKCSKKDLVIKLLINWH